MSIFTRTIKICLRPDEVSFADEHHSIAVRPFVFLDPADANRILAIGSAPDGVQTVARRLFDETDALPDQHLLITSYLRFGISLFFGFSFRATIVEFAVSPEIVQDMGTDYQSILSQAGKHAGAFTASFAVT